MPPKGPSKKTVEKQKLKVVEDKTFGLKNKNKSKKVQKQIATLKQTATSGNQRKTGLSEAEQRKQRKLEEKQRIKELEMIFKPVETKKQREEREAAERESGIVPGDSSEDDSSETYSTDEEDDELTLEEIIEKERQKIINGTPVTAESFQQWKELKRLRLENQEKSNREDQIMQFRSSGTGMTGKNLFTYDATLFIDDDEAADALIYENREEEEEQIDGNVQVGDASLFADDAGIEGASTGFKQLRIFDPDLWTEKDPPKQLLAEFLAKNKHEMAIFEKVECAEEGMVLYKAILPHLENREFIPSEPSRNRKIAENNASLMVFDYLTAQAQS